MLQILFAFLAGILTLAAPCILPILPIMLGDALGRTNKTRPLFIVAGFVLTFSLAAVGIEALTRHLGLRPNLIRDIGVILLIFFGLLLLWPTPFELMMLRFNGYFNKLSSTGDPAKTSNWSGFVLGATLGLIWTPCAGPVLASILTLVALQKDFAVALILLIAYSLGAGVPMLIISYGGQFIGRRVTFLSRYLRQLQQFFGLIIILLAVAIYFNYDIKIYSSILKYFPNFNPKL